MELDRLKIDRTRSAGPRRAGSPWFARLLALALLALALWFFRAPLLRLSDRVRLPGVEAYQVRAESPSSAAAIRGTAANGYVVAARRAALSADTPGRIVAMHVTEGQRVAAGTVVAELFADEYAAAVAAASAEHEAAVAALEQARAAERSSRLARDGAQQDLAALRDDVEAARAAAALADQELERVTPLVDGGVVSAREKDTAVSERDASAARLRASQTRVAAAEAALSLAEARIAEAAAEVVRTQALVTAAAATLDRAKATLDKTLVRAPFDGIVVLKDAEVGEVVSPNSQGGSNARGAVCTLVDFESLEVQCDLPETSLGAIELGAPAAIYLDAWPDQRYDGTVDRIWPTADRQKATIEVRVRFARRDERLRPDMGVRVVFGAEPAPAAEDAEPASAPALLVPEEALVQTDGRTGVFVIERDAVRFQELTLGERRSGRVEVLSGLSDGQRIVRRPSNRLASGDRVRVQES